MSTYATSFAPTPYGHHFFDEAQHNADEQWRQQYYSHMPMLAQQWSNSHTGDERSLDIRFGVEDQCLYPDTYQCDQWSNATTPEGCHPTQESSDYSNAYLASSNQMQTPEVPILQPAAYHSPGWTHSSVSPSTSPVELPLDFRQSAGPPALSRESTATASDCSGFIKKVAIKKEKNDATSCEDSSKRSRKRQRIPHTAVERRYRENLNAHLEKLRQHVPTLAGKKGFGVGAVADQGESGKPSKCEILSSAIEHIDSLGRENAMLSHEVQALRIQVAELLGMRPICEGIAADLAIIRTFDASDFIKETAIDDAASLRKASWVGSTFAVSDYSGLIRI